jgi:hypothetical protein
MTLVAALTILNTPVLVGDILLSREGVNATAGLPTRLDAGTLMPPGYAVAGVRRKLAVLHDRLVVGWAGSEVGARSVIRELRSRAQGAGFDRDRLREFLRADHNLGRVQVRLVSWLVPESTCPDSESHRKASA